MTSCKPPPTCIDASPIPDANDSRMSAIPYEANLTPMGQRLPACGSSGGLSLARLLGRFRPIRALGQAAEAVGDQIDRVDPAAVPLVAALPQAPAHMDQIALRDVLRDVGLGGGAEHRDLVPIRIRPPRYGRRSPFSTPRA